VHAEAAGAAGAGGEEDVTIDDFLLRYTLLFQALQVLHQVAHGEISGIALAVVAVLLSGLEGAYIGRGDSFGAIAQTFERAVHQLLVLPGQTAEQQRGIRTLIRGKGLLDRSLEMVGLARDEAR